MKSTKWNSTFSGLCKILYCLIILFFEFQDITCFILEKTVSVCNGQCALVNLACPPLHGIAIREALYGVHMNGPVCPATTSCDRVQSDLCCEKTPSSDCILPYPVDRLEPLHKGCSGKEMCEVNIVGNQDLAKVCNTANKPPQPNTTYTILDYVCVNDTFTADFCSDTTVTVSGRTVFALFDAKTAKTHKGGKLCTCVAHSTTWPIENPISVFVVDIRLNKAASDVCSDSMVSISAGKTIKDINCKSVHDPGFPYPFVSVLNSTTVALAQLVLHDETPEYVWVGFEASLDEEIRVSCGIHGWKNGHVGVGPTMEPDGENGGQILPPDQQPATIDNNVLPIAAIVGGFAGGVILTIIIALIIVFALRSRKPKPTVEPDLIEPYATIEATPATPTPRKEPKGKSKKSKKIVFEAPMINYAAPWDITGNIMDMANYDPPGVEYVDAEEVRNKKKADKQKSRELPIPKEEEYVDASEVRKKKLEDQKSAAETKQTQYSAGKRRPGDYDLLTREKERECPTPPGYDHIKGGVYMDIEKDDGSENHYQSEDGIYENGGSFQERQTDSNKLAPPPLHYTNDSDGGSDSSYNKNQIHISTYELARALELRK